MTNLFALIALLGWIPVSAAIFLWLPAARSLSVSYVAGWLLLPFVTYQLPGLPDFGKATTILLGSSLGLMLHKDAGRLLGAFRMSWIDIPAIVLCLGTLVTSLLNGLGIWDGVSGAFGMLCMWAGPYFLGRIVYRSVDDLKELAKVIFWGGLFYVPLCLFEIRMSPQLHMDLYGVAPRGGWDAMRYGGYRPGVFLEGGLELGMWMTASCLAGFVLWRQGKYRQIGNVQVSLLLFVLFATTVLCKSTGALALLVMGLGCWVAGRHLKSWAPVAILILVSVAYIVVRGSGLYDGSDVVEFTRQFVAEDRASSLDFRLKNEDLLGARALEQPWFGWGGWGRSRVYNDEGTEISVSDGRWIIIFGQLGLVGLLGTYGTLVFPCLAATRRFGSELCRSEAVAPVAALSLIVAVFAIDSLLNDFPNPIYLLSAGAVGSSALLELREVFRRETLTISTELWPTVARQNWPPPNRKVPAKSDT